MRGDLENHIARRPGVHNDTDELYWHKVAAREIARGTMNAVPDSGRRLVDVLQKKAARNASTISR
jgi:hypothetical protein